MPTLMAISHTIVLVTVLATATPPQEPSSSKPSTAAPADRDAAPEGSEDVIVQGLRDLNSAGSLVTTKTLNSAKLGVSPRDSNQTFTSAARFFAYAIKPARQVALLRAAVDGTMNSVRQDNAQRRFVQTNAACAVDGENALVNGAASVASVDYSSGVQLVLDTYYYDRGAMFVRVLQIFAPHLKLTRKQTEDAEVQRRLAVREAPRARLRFQQDRRYFDAAICFVRYEPALAARLVLTDRPVARYEELEAAIVNGARKPCVGAVRAVYFDPLQFRFYIADALYRWAVAAAGVETLIDASVAPEDQAVRGVDPVKP